MEKQAAYAPGNEPPPYPGPGQGYPPPPAGAYPQGQPGYPPNQAGYPPNQPGYPQTGAPAGYTTTQTHQVTVVQGQNVPASGAVVVVAGGNCPRCQTGHITEEFTCCGIVLAILFFPLGLLCCWLMRERRCTNCGAGF